MTQTHVTLTLPHLGEDVTQATIGRWLAVPGDRIDADAPLLEVATDKVDTEIPAPQAGILLETLVGEDEVVEVGAALAIIAVSATCDMTEQVSVRPAQHPPAPHRDGEPVTPRLLSGDNTPAPDRESTVERLPRIRQLIASRMLDSLQTSAQLTTVIEVDVTGISQLRAATKAQFQLSTGTKLTYLPFFVRATVEALVEHPVLGAVINAECTEATYHHGVDMGIAVDSPKGLMVPVIRDAHRMGIADIAVSIADLAEQVRAATIGPDSLSGGTFTVTNTGSRGALFDTPILNKPQSGILGTGAVVERVVPTRDAHGNIVFSVRSMVYLALTYDHRIVDGADAARFLDTVKRQLESGYTAEELFSGPHTTQMATST